MAKAYEAIAARHGRSRLRAHASLPLVSIVIPHYNRADLLAETLRSLEAQKYPNWEVVVVDDGSEPEQWTTLQRFANRHVRMIQRTDGLKGPSRCRNLGAAAARGEYLIFLDSDDQLAPWCLAQRMKAVYAEPQFSLWVFQVLLFREVPGDMDVCWNRLEGDDDLERFLRGDPPWHTSSPIWRKDAFFELGGFNEKVMYGDDAELHARALLRLARCRKHPQCEPDVFIRRGDASRITNAGSKSLQHSRLMRLIEGTHLLREVEVSPTYHAAWEGQYFVEGEQLLFNSEAAERGIRKVFEAWLRLYRPSFARRVLVKWYFATGLMFRSRAYWVLRANRRLAKMILPSGYFPSGGWFQQWTLEKKQREEFECAMRRFTAGEAPKT